MKLTPRIAFLTVIGAAFASIAYQIFTGRYDWAEAAGSTYWMAVGVAAVFFNAWLYDKE